MTRLVTAKEDEDMEVIDHVALRLAQRRSQVTGALRHRA
jgi:hypothetical protein